MNFAAQWYVQLLVVHLWWMAAPTGTSKDNWCCYLHYRQILPSAVISSPEL